ncbi:MAG TPA: hypothetical protein VD902_19465, partial [Symbiobacteriaceae bacterium]|nr:hypothetical protein [Symbiobacteriaceae bacterium]
MRRLLIALLLVLIPAVASADSLVPGRPAGSSDYGTAVPLYDDPRYDPSAYTFEGAEWNSTAYATLYFWTNQMLIAKAWLLKSAIRVAEYALLEPVPSSLAASASDAMESVHILLWTGGAPLVMAGLGLAGLYALVLRLR